jgi:hypothetical protein
LRARRRRSPRKSLTIELRGPREPGRPLLGVAGRGWDAPVPRHPSARGQRGTDRPLSAIERDRLAHVAFVTSVNRTNEGKTAQEARDVTQADEDAYEAASGVEEHAVSGMTAFGGQS